MRLIDADNIEIDENCVFSGKGLNEFFKAIPTAYDVGIVIRMLTERAEHAESKAAEYDEKGNAEMMDIWDSESKLYRNAIEIVKAGELFG